MESLKDFNTFGVQAFTPKLHIISSRLDLEQFHFNSKNEYFILGGGSNLLLTKDLDIPVLKNEIKGHRVVQESVDEVWVQCGGGENWHEFVLWTLDQGYSGLENLSLIPGTVGASPIQNIGAYGVEVKDVIEQVTTYSLLEEEIVIFNKDACAFAYRDSFFKKAENKGKFFVTHVTFKLSKDFNKINTSYGAINQSIADIGILEPTAKDISNAVIKIRESKLPDPAVIGNSGSFFKNPIVEKSVLENIAEQYEKVPNYPIDDKSVKIPAGWLIEKCGWKGKQVGQTGNYAHQALIIVNHGNATGNEIHEHAKNVRDSVEEKFNIRLEFEVNII